ncbi:penicillin-binding protein 1A [Natronobacillus azotifigens]|uniref:PBP1A family penicillin-binding protein n=1 Tax=Natronobacillus azotifigens TaxID=472978 RepID=A0A9J6R9E2_9BACI|nr:penicillin-binding protein 1A [Natronobacillus azotifigens]MCZ0701889.1 PBP1A family penicillin-binding protein [Natronobacillus azotifigens]
MANNSQSRTQRRIQQKEMKKNKPSIWKKIMLSLLAIFLLTIIGVGSVFSYYIFTAPELDHALLVDPTSTKVYDMNAELFADLGTERRTSVNYEDFPEVLIDAVLAAEDVRFYDHSGIDIRRIGGAVLANVSRGFGAEGGSTITQQVVKGAFLSTDQTVKRKVQEQWIALQLDRSYEKDEILEMYLNKIYYGAGAYGVATAAEVYFGKTLDELTLPEAALLAGLPQRPSAYDPTVNPDLAERRMNTVLNLMVRHEKITEEEADEARAVSIEDMLNITQRKATPYRAFLDQVAKEMEDKLGIDIYTDSLEIHTTLDPSAQQHVERVLSEDSPISFPDDRLQSGIAVVDTQTGAIRAIGGGRNRQAGDWNYAIQGDGRQPGSAIKPIISFGPAIEHLNWSTYEQINDDAPFEVTGTDPIRNWDRNNHGWMTARRALEQSYNVPSAKALDAVGLSQAQAFAEGLGIKFYDDQINIRDAIGGTETGVTPLQMAGAYSAFGNAGIYNEPYAVSEVVFPDGHKESFRSTPEAAMSDSTAYMITDMLKTVVSSGTGTAANIPGLPVAGKTGTTDNNSNVWFAGYTTNYSISIWAGYPDSNTEAVKDTRISRLLFKELMSSISSGKDTPDFEMPNSVVRVGVERGSNPAKLPSEYTPDSQIVTELFKRGHEPKQSSERFDQLAAVRSLKATYDESSNQINLSWNYGNEDVTFEVRYGTNGSANNQSTTEDTSFTISNVERGSTYTIEVSAVSNRNSSNRSDTERIEIKIPEEEVEEPEPEEPEEPEEPQEETPDPGNNGNRDNQGNSGNDSNSDDSSNDENGDDEEDENDPDEEPDDEETDQGD